MFKGSSEVKMFFREDRKSHINIGRAVIRSTVLTGSVLILQLRTVKQLHWQLISTAFSGKLRSILQIEHEKFSTDKFKL